jgi:hypothetical protein
LAKQPEGKLSLKIIDAWKAMGAWAYKVHGSEYQPSGIPDISGVFLGHSVWCETKMPGNKPSMIQWKQIRDLRRRGALVIVSYTLTDAVQMLKHIESNEHARVDCGCLYVEPIDLLQKKRDKDYK